MKHLLLMTSAFPTGPDETFLEPELPVIAREFDKITIIPMKVRPGARQMPANVEVATDYSDTRWGPQRGRWVVYGLLKGLTRAVAWRELGEALLGGLRDPRRMAAWLTDWVRCTYRVELYARAVSRLPQRPSICYHYWFTPEALGAHYALAATATQARVPVVLRTHSGDLWEDVQPSRHFAYRAPTMPCVDQIYPVSDFGRAYLVGRYPEFAHKVITQRLGVTGRGVANAQPVDGLSILSLSLVNRRKRLDRIIDALELLARWHPNLPIRWTHIGDGELMAQVKQQAARLPANVQVDLRGRLTNPAVLELLKTTSFDCIVNTSESEGIPVSIMEAFSAGIPAVAPAVGGIAEILEHGGGVLLASQPTTDSIADALQVFIDKRSSADTRREAFDTWRARYDSQRNFGEFARRLLDLAGLTCDGSGATQALDDALGTRPAPQGMLGQASRVGQTFR